MTKNFLVVLLLSLVSTSQAQVIINEIFLKPSNQVCSDDNFLLNANQASCGSEWIELYNPSPCGSFDLSCYTLAASFGTNPLSNTTESAAFQFPAGSIIAPLGFLVVGGPNATNVAVSPASSLNNPNLCLQNVDAWVLEDQAGWLALYDPNGEVVDAIFWAGDASEIATNPIFAGRPCIPSACGGIDSLLAANEILSIEFVQASGLGLTDNSIARESDASTNWLPPSAPSPANCNAVCLSPEPFSFNANVLPESCGQANGQIELVLTGGTTPFSFEWSHDSLLNSNIASNLVAGTYTVTITDASFCQKDTTITFEEVEAPTISATINQPTCGANDGTINLSVSGGTFPFLYNWSTGQGGPAILNASAGEYTATIIDGAGCRIDTTFYLSDVGGPTVDIDTVIDVSCFGLSDGSASLSIAGGEPVASWSNGQSGTNLQNVAAGEYVATVTDTSGCEVWWAIQIEEPEELLVRDSSVADTCGQAIGQAIAIVEGGTLPYEFLWDAAANNQTTSTATNLTEGNYAVDITDANGCLANIAVSIADSGSLSVKASVQNIRCAGLGDGRVELEVEGGSGNYSFAWTDSVSNSFVADSLRPGIYIVTVIDTPAAVCQFTDTFTIAEPEPIIANPTITDATCPNNDGAVSLNPTGGVPGYTYEWSTNPPQYTSSLQNLYSGVYFCDITDANGCTRREEIIIQTPSNHQVEIEVIEEDLCGLSEGVAYAFVTGGTPPFVVSWPSASTGFLGENIPQGQTRVFVTDSLGCLMVSSLNMPGNPALEILALESKDNYCDLSNGSAYTELGGGTPPYEYEWRSVPRQYGSQATGLSAGDYRMVATDSLGCEISDVVQIQDEVAFDLEVNAVDATCEGDSTGMLVTSVNGGVPPFAYSWEHDAGADGSILENMPKGIYNLSVKDSLGCVKRAFGIVDGPDAIEANFYVNGDTTGGVVLSASGIEFENSSVGATSYFWDFGDSTTTSATSPLHVYERTGLYPVTLYAYNEEGCIDSIISPIRIVDDGTVFVPTVFSPDGNGRNDVMQVKGSFINDYSIQIFNRRGLVIYESNSIAEPWDGRTLQGGMAIEGVYVYRVKAIVRGDKLIERIGTVTLVR